MSRYIDADALLQELKNKPFISYTDIIKRQPTADVVEVVRCKDCEHYEAHGNGKAGLCKNKKCKGIRYENDYCGDGERREQ